MNIQIYGRSKCFDTKKAQMYFKERKITFQLVDLDRYSLGKRELEICVRAVGLENLINKKSPLYSKLNLDKMRTNEMICDVMIENPKVFATPIVRNGKDVTVGNCPEIWKGWV